jgi:hypothetical protein
MAEERRDGEREEVVEEKRMRSEDERVRLLEEPNRSICRGKSGRVGFGGVSGVGGGVGGGVVGIFRMGLGGCWAAAMTDSQTTGEPLAGGVGGGEIPRAGEGVGR